MRRRLPLAVLLFLAGLLTLAAGARADPDAPPPPPPPPAPTAPSAVPTAEAPSGAAASAVPASEAPAPVDLVTVPDVRRLEPREAAEQLVAAGLDLGRIFAIVVPEGWELGRVVQQSPPPTTADEPRRMARGGVVHIRVASARAGPAEGWSAPLDWPRTVPVAPPAPDADPTDGGSDEPSAVPGGDGESVGEEAPLPGVAPTGPVTALPEGPPPAPLAAAPGEAPEVIPAPEGPDTVPVEAPAGPVASPEGPPSVTPPAQRALDDPRLLGGGSPDAPTVAPPSDPGRVPALLGLPLADAEHRVRSAEMALHVDRVAGHPVGHVLEQAPEPGSTRPPGGVIRVVVAAGGDHLAATAPPPTVAVRDVEVPDLLDRTEPQVRRILEALGLVPEVRAALRGPPGRVADQRPAAGDVVAKGSTVMVKVAPVAPSGADVARPPPQDPPQPADESVGRAPVPAGSGPLPLAPAAGTILGSERAMAIGFTWRPVGGADAYVVEVEERGPDGWMPNARRVARSNAIALDVERIGVRPGPLRWRVRAVVSGRQGAPCPWVELR